MYTLKIPQKQLSDLWHAREYLGRGSIAGQVRYAVDKYLKEEVEKEIGAPISDVCEVLKTHEHERESAIV